MQLNQPTVAAYRGEPIDIRAVLEQIRLAAEQAGWGADGLIASGSVAYRRLSRFPSHRIYLSSGIHGNEPAGPLGILELIKANRWPSSLEMWTCPCLNVGGFIHNQRESLNGVDLNRDYRSQNSEEVRTHIAWLRRKPNFDLAVCLHEDHSASGFYLQEYNPDERHTPSKRIISRVAEVCPIARGSLVHGCQAENGVVLVHQDPYHQSEWTEAAFLATSKTKLCYTFKTPSQLPLAVRANAFVKAVQALAEWVVTDAV